MDKRVMALASVGLAGSVGVILFLTLAGDQPVFWLPVVLLGILMVICETLGEKMGLGGRSTYGIIVLFAAITALNTPSAMIVAFFGAFHLGLFRQKDDPWGLIFTGAMYAICTWAAAAVYHALGGASIAFTLSEGLKSIIPVLVAAGVFWALNTMAMAFALTCQEGIRPKDFIISDALKLLPNHLLYSLVGLSMGVIFAQNAFYFTEIPALDESGNPFFDEFGNMVMVSSLVKPWAGALRGFFAVLCFTAILGVAWHYSGRNIELLESYDRSMEVLVTHLEKREPYLDGHAVRVAGYAALIARQMRFPLHEVNRLRHAALLHDLGRPAVPLDILLQPSALSEEEFEKIKVHPLEGGSRLEEVEYLADMAEAVRHHHEYYDGGGYIDHLSGDTIPVTARIIAVADAYDSMMNRRPWREAKGPQRALAELRENSGRQFDPEIVENFIAAMEDAERRESEAASMPSGVAEEKEPGTEEKEGHAGRRRKTRREEMLRERREARERLERDAMRSLEGTEADEMEGGGEAPGITGDRQAGGPEGEGEAQ